MSSTTTARPAHGAAPFGSIRVHGAQAREFLQGQLTADLNTLTAARTLLACCNSPQGRVQAVMWLIERSDGIILLLAASMVETTAARLRKYVLRSKVVIEPAPSLALTTLETSALPAQVSLGSAGAHQELAGVSYLRLPGHEVIVQLGAGPAGEPAPESAATWRLAEIRAGVPHVYPSTHEAFVAQMLNLDLLGGISFQKGCYTGQEIVARAHFRGTIKRRMLRLRGALPPPPPGTRITTGTEHAGDVVDAAASEGGCELLAVINLAQRAVPLAVQGFESAPLELLPLPYEV